MVDLCESTGCTSTIPVKDDWSTIYTIEREVDHSNTVSKYMNDNTLDPRPVHIYFRRPKIENTFGDLKFVEQNDTRPVKIVFCSAWSELVSSLALNPKTICVNADELQFTSCLEIVNMIGTLAKLASIEKMTITLGVTKETTLQQVKEAQKSEMFGIVPTSEDFPGEETARALTAQWNQIPYWPKHIIDQLPGNKKVVRKVLNEIQLTPRQQQILDLIKERGASNKTIAKTLNIAESTVKLHVGIVLKKFGVKNRTQLALFSKK